MKNNKPKTSLKKKNKAPNHGVQEFFSSIESKPEYVKHMIECQCYLPQYKNIDNPINHRFVVFSELDEQGVVKPSYAACNNCSIVYRVVEVCKAIPAGKESSSFIETIEDIEAQLPEKIGKLLKQNECDLHVWQEAKFIIENELWGRFVVLSKERNKEYSTVYGKICQILGKDLLKIEVFERDEWASLN